MPYSMLSLLSFPVPFWMVAIMMFLIGRYRLRNRSRAQADASAGRTEITGAPLEVGPQPAPVIRAPVKRLTMDDLRPRPVTQH